VKVEQRKEKLKKGRKKQGKKNENERGLERPIMISLSSPSKDVKL
jgi:hypothetical protein